MAKPLSTVWDIEAHTSKKHQILKIYFQAWLPIMAKWNGRVLFIDGFAGPGKYSGGEDGSPVIVLTEAVQHPATITAEIFFVFIEKDPRRAEHLRMVLRTQFPALPRHIRYEVAQGSFDSEMRSALDDLREQKKKFAPAFVFIDPFGFSHTPFEIVRQILENPKSEVLINFMFEEVNRFLSLPDQAENYDRLFGTSEWRSAVEIGNPTERRRFLHDLYLRQLKKHARYVRSFEMLNKGNTTDYFLFFATNSIRGLEKMKEAMCKVDPTGDYGFSDFTDAQGVQNLFSLSTDTHNLKQELLKRFKGKQVKIEDLQEFVIAETPFLTTHLKRPVLAPMESVCELRIVRSKENRRKGTFPDGTVIEFL